VVVRRFFGSLLCVASLSSFGHSIEIRKLDELRRALGVDRYDSVAGVRERMRSLKVAILDKGFGDSATLSQELPPSVFKVVSAYDAALIEKYGLGKPDEQLPLEDRDEHGRAMALLLWGVTGFSTTDAPRIHLLNANGLTNFSRAVHYCKEEKIDIVLFSQNWEYGGNFDGLGFINKLVNVATDAGILWVNAAGNYGRRVHNSRVTVGPSQWVRLGNRGLGLRLRSRLDRNPVKIVLSWNQYTEEETSGTDKDLDLYVVDEGGNEVLKADLKQIKKTEGAERAQGESYVPREIVEGRLSRGNYFIRVKAKGGVYDSLDWLRITVMGQSASYYDDTEKATVDPFEFPDATEGGEIMVPADHARVIAVGDKSLISARGPTMDGRAKPDVVLESSQVDFSDGQGSSGTSNAAALFAGVLTVLKAHQPGLKTHHLLKYTEAERVTAAKLTGERAGIQDLGVDAFRRAQPGIVEAVEGILGKGSIQLAGRKESGLFVAALDRSPLALGKFFKNLPAQGTDPREWEIFLAEVDYGQGNRRVQAYWRNPKMGPGTQTWEKVLEERPDRFVKVVQASRIPEGNLPVLPVWKTPEPAKNFMLR
jgi:hypothetical protein